MTKSVLGAALLIAGAIIVQPLIAPSHPRLIRASNSSFWWINDRSRDFRWCVLYSLKLVCEDLAHPDNAPALAPGTPGS